jgi:hypothetical protein
MPIKHATWTVGDNPTPLAPDRHDEEVGLIC